MKLFYGTNNSNQFTTKLFPATGKPEFSFKLQEKSMLYKNLNLPKAMLQCISL